MTITKQYVYQCVINCIIDYSDETTYTYRYILFMYICDVLFQTIDIMYVTMNKHQCSVVRAGVSIVNMRY